MPLTTCAFNRIQSRTLWQSTLLILWLAADSLAAPRELSFSQSTSSVEAYDFVEIAVNVEGPDARNPFSDVDLRGSFGKVGSSERINVGGFCDSTDGSVFRIRFMPLSPGSYAYSVAYRQGEFEKSYDGTFRATDGHRRGPIRDDPKYPWHFIWEGTGEHYFFNGTTAFWLMGWRDERTIQNSIDRLRRLKVNRIRVLLSGAANTFWGGMSLPSKSSILDSSQTKNCGVLMALSSMRLVWSQSRISEDT